MKRYISAAQYRQDIQDKLDDQAATLIDHLIKTCCFDEDRYHDGWIQEIYAAINKVPKVKDKNDYPDSNFIFDSIWQDEERRFHSRYGYIISDYSDKIPQRTEEETKEIVISYIQWLSDILSIRGRIDNRPVETKINELLSY